jgi:hypothetical protein
MTTASSKNLGDRLVDCSCDSSFHWPVLLEGTGAGTRVAGCLRCGTASYTFAACDEPRAGDIRFHGNLVVELPPSLMEWLIEWPRVRTRWRDARWPMSAVLVRQDVLYLPAATRYPDAGSLDATVAMAEREQSGKPSGQRLRQAGPPRREPPENLPVQLDRYRSMWDALALTPASELRDLFRQAQLVSSASAVAVDALLRRPDVDRLILSCLGSTDPVEFSAGYAMARDRRPVPPDLEPLLVTLLGQLSIERNREVPGRIASAGRAEELLVLIADLALGSAPMIAALRRLKQRVIKRDGNLVKYIDLVLRELAGGGNGLDRLP